MVAIAYEWTLSHLCWLQHIEFYKAVGCHGTHLFSVRSQQHGGSLHLHVTNREDGHVTGRLVERVVVDTCMVTVTWCHMVGDVSRVGLLRLACGYYGYRWVT